MGELKYPVKYAIMEVYDKGGASVDYEPVVLGYIVSKCYVCEEIIKHLKNGKEKVYYKVVFPYQNYKLFRDCQACNINFDIRPEKPKYDENENVINSSIVNYLYDTYDEAKEEANTYNTKLLLDLIDSIKKYGGVFSSKLLCFEREFYRDLNKSLKFEEAINNITKDISLSTDEKALKLKK